MEGIFFTTWLFVMIPDSVSDDIIHNPLKKDIFTNFPMFRESHMISQHTQYTLFNELKMFNKNLGLEFRIKILTVANKVLKGHGIFFLLVFLLINVLNKCVCVGGGVMVGMDLIQAFTLTSAAADRCQWKLPGLPAHKYFS